MLWLMCATRHCCLAVLNSCGGCVTLVLLGSVPGSAGTAFSNVGLSSCLESNAVIVLLAMS